MGVSRASDISGGSFLKPKEYYTATAVLFEPRRLDKDVDSKFGRRDEIVGDFTIFETEEALEKGEPSEVLKSAKCSNSMIVSSLAKVIDGAAAGVLRDVPTKNGSGPAIRDLAKDKHYDLIDKYIESRAAATAEALANVPDFD